MKTSNQTCSSKLDDDIRLFISSEFDDIKGTHPFRSRIPTSWPSKSVTEVLVKKSAVRFSVAAALIRFVASFDHLPHERLKDILAFYDNDCTLARLLEFLDDRRVLAPPPHHNLLVLSAQTLTFPNPSLPFLPGPVHPIRKIPTSHFVDVQFRH